MDEVPEISRSVYTLTDRVLQWFVDRERALRRFRAMLAGQDLALVLVVEGPTGIGKTWLLERLRQEAKAQAVQESVIDFASGEAFDDLLLVQWAALRLGSHHFETLNDTLEEATQLEVVLKVESGTDSGGVTFHGDAEVYGDVAGRDIIKGNTFNVQVGSQVIRIWQERINKAFFTDLAQLAVANGAVLLYDSFEQATDEASLWIKNRLLRSLGEGELPGVRVAIAGRQVPTFPSTWHDLVAELRLGPLPAAEVRTYLRDKGGLVISEAVIASVYELTGGRPDLLAIYAYDPDALPEHPDRDRLLEILVEGILKNADDRTRELLRTVAIAEWFDDHVLADLMGTTTGVDEHLANLRGYPFVQVGERGRLRFPQAVRKVLLQTWAEQPTKFRILHDRAAHHFSERAHNAADPGLREEFERQAVGHLLAMEEKESMARDRLRALFEANEAAHRLAVCQRLVERAEAVEGLSDLTQAWLRYLRGRLALARNKYDTSADLFTELLREIDAGPELRALASWSLGQVNAELGEWTEAVEYYKDSLEYLPRQTDTTRPGRVMLALGDVHLQQAHALGGLIRPRPLRGRGWWRLLQAIPGLLVALPFMIYAWAIRRWRFLPPLHHGMNYRNWTLVRLLLTAVEWYRDAESLFAEARQEALLADARQRLAQTYHRLGWWHAARSLFSQVLGSITNAYRRAQVLKESADTELAAGNTDEAIEQLEKSLEIFKQYEDVQSQAQARALLWQAWVQKGDFQRGLALFRESLEGFSSIGDRLGIGLALRALRHWVQRSDPTPDQADQVQELITGTREKTYFPRVPDRLASVLELAVMVGLILLPVLSAGSLIMAGLSNWTSQREFFANLFSAGNILTWLGRLAVLTWILIVGSGLLGLILVSWSARRKLEPERLDRIVTSDDAITRYDYRNQELGRIPWSEVQAIVSVERVLWRTPIPLLSEFWLFGSETTICVPATMLWYDAIKRDIEDHVERHNVRPTRRHLGTDILRSRLGLFFTLFPVLLVLGNIIIYNWMELTMRVGLAAFVGPLLYNLGLLALVAGLYWWLFLHPLWVRYQLASRSQTPVMVGAVGLIIVAFAFFLSYQRPFFAIRNNLNRLVFPLGFLLSIIAPLWVLGAREWAQKMVLRGKPAYPSWMRAVAAIVLLGAVILTGLFTRRDWFPDVFYNFQAITHFFHKDYQGTVDRFTHLLELNDDLVNGYFYRGRAHIHLGQYQLAVNDLSRVIDSGSAIAADYVYRAKAFQAMGDLSAACADLQSALDAQRWSLSEEERLRIKESYWQPWGCNRTDEP